ncbi:hypothetical protein Zm00014a_024739 [Zea mays]|uniref:Uncharacterized protein n=1 Tax=Zea mays TaxID=4577 RepID=A0A3L6FA98_MAIZE|nr:hypothetical protein Zm00014a_024739 [Zea mays]
MDRFYRSPSISQGPFDIDLAHSRAQAQPRVDIMLRGGSRDKLGKALAKWFHANDIPGRKADCPYFRSAIKLAQECGQGVHIPSGKDLDGKFLDMNYEDMEAHMAKFKDDWKEYGVTVMCDSWTGNPIMDWLCNSRSESTPILDEYDDNELESPIPSRVLMDELGMDVEVTALKRKLDFNTREGKKKRKAGLVDIEEEIEDDVESDSSDVGDEFGDEWEFRGPSGGGACEVGPSGGGACDVGPSGDGSRDGAMHEQAAPNPPLRPRSTRLKKVPVKELYKVRQTSNLCI